MKHTHISHYFRFVIGAMLCALVLGSGVVHAAEQLYTCAMHPQILKKEPGNCPICGMKLELVRTNTGSGGAPAASSNQIHIDAATVQRMNLKTVLIGSGPVSREIRAVGTVAYNEKGLRDITTKYEGWLERVHVDATWTAVKAGDPLFEIYSPDVYNAQLNYLVALRTEGREGGPLTRAALARLQLFDLPQTLIDEIARAGEPRRTVVFRAPVDGMVIEKMGVVGQMMRAGERIYRLADLSSVWVLAQVYESDLPFVQTGQAATVRTNNGPQHTLQGKVQLLLPEVQAQTRTATARIVLDNPERMLRPGMFVDVVLTRELASSAMLVPDEAVLRSGERNTVFVAKEGGMFEPREVQLGARANGRAYQVVNGLTAGERVVTSGQFLLDSESQLREAIQKMLKAEAASAAPVSSSKSSPRAVPPPGVVPETLKTLAFALADASAALAADDLAAYQKQLPGLRTKLSAYIKTAPQSPAVKFKDALPQATDLKAARRAFEPFSTMVADLAREHGLQSAGLHFFECPMAPVLGKGRWIQRQAGTKNPFFGSAMLGCGEELK